MIILFLIYELYIKEKENNPNEYNADNQEYPL